jgi:hypothetical protein
MMGLPSGITNQAGGGGGAPLMDMRARRPDERGLDPRYSQMPIQPKRGNELPFGATTPNAKFGNNMPQPMPKYTTGYTSIKDRDAQLAGGYAGSIKGKESYPTRLMESGGGVNGPMPQPMPQQAPQYDVNTAAAQGLQRAQMGASAEMGYRPMAIGAPSQANLQQYTNPYENQVVNQSLSDIERARQMQQNAGGAQAGAANAFGGSRHGIAEAETNRAYADQSARTASGLRQTGYKNAQDMARQASMQNQQAGLQGSQQRLKAGSQLGNLSNLGFGMGQQIQGRMDQQGAMQQALQQQLINAGKQQYAGYTGAPAQSLQYLLQAVGGAPAVGNTTQEKTAGLFDYAGLGLYGMGQGIIPKPW